MNKTILERAERVTRETIAPRASQYDVAGANPIESWRALWREGLLAGTVPTAHGGLGLDMPTYIAVIRAVARGCANTGMTLHMHSTVMRFIDALGTAAQKRRYFDEVVRHGKLFGSWGSEPAVSLSRTLLMETAIRRDATGYVIDGVKHFCTMALGAAHYMIWCALEGGTDMAKSLQLALVPAETPGIATDGKWDTLGMRATFSPSVTFTGVRVPDDGMLGDPGRRAPRRRHRELRARVRGDLHRHRRVGAGLRDGLRQEARRADRRTSPSRMDPTVQRHIGELAAHLEAAGLVLDDSAARWDAADPAELGPLANRAKYLATEVGLQVTSKVIQVVGGRGSYKDFPAERAFRDLRTCTLMPPTVDRMLEAIGKNALGLDAAMFNVSGTPPRADRA